MLLLVVRMDMVARKRRVGDVGVGGLGLDGGRPRPLAAPSASSASGLTCRYWEWISDGYACVCVRAR